MTEHGTITSTLEHLLLPVFGELIACSLTIAGKDKYKAEIIAVNTDQTVGIVEETEETTTTTTTTTMVGIDLLPG